MIKTRSRAIALALSGMVVPGLHKFYLKQRGWGIAYLLLYPTAMPQLASLLEGLWYAIQGQQQFDQTFNPRLAYLQSHPQTPLKTTADIALAARLNQTIDVNRATEQDWERLPVLSADQRRSLLSLTRAGLQFHSLEDMAAALSLPIERLQPLAPVLRFYYYEPLLNDPVLEESALDAASAPVAIADVSAAPTKLNPNQATAVDLLTIPCVDAVLLTAILRQRTDRPFQSLADFQQRLSLSAETTAEVMHYLCF